MIRVDNSTGKIHWRARPEWMFETRRAYKQFNTNFAGKQTNPGYKQFKMLGVTWQKSRASWFYHTGQLPDGDVFKVLTVNRNVLDVRIENLVLVPVHISIRQKKGICEVRNTTTYIYGTCYKKRDDQYCAYYNDLDGTVKQKQFDIFEDALDHRKMYEPPERYVTLENYITGDKQLVDPPEVEEPSEHTFIDVVLTETHRRRISIANTGKFGTTSSRFKGYLVGTHEETGDQIRFEGGGDADKHGYKASNIYACINGRKPRYKQHTWKREEI